MRSTKNVSVWPVGFISSLKAEGCIVKNGKVRIKYKTAVILYYSNGPRREKPCLRGGGCEQQWRRPVYAHSMISAFDTGISKLVAGEISIFYLVSEVEQTGLSLALSETPKQVLSRRGLVYK